MCKECYTMFLEETIAAAAAAAATAVAATIVHEKKH